MNLGQLVRSKLKEMSADLSGEYIDKMGKHFAMSAAGDGYTVSYGGEAKHEVEITKPQAMKLAKNCRKLEMADNKKDLSLKKLGQDSWTMKRDYWEKFYKQDYYGKVVGHNGQNDWQWDLMDETMHSVAAGREKTVEAAKAKCDSAAASRL